MQTEQEVKQRRPFHETIVKAIRQASRQDTLVCLAMLIETTQIPKGHDEIITAWDERWPSFFEQDLGIPANLLEQKREAENEKKEKEKKAKEQVAAAASWSKPSEYN